MLNVTIKSAIQYIMKDDDWEWLLANMNKPLRVLSLSFMHDNGELWCISVYKEKSDGVDCVSLFVEQNKLQFKFEGELPCWNL